MKVRESPEYANCVDPLSEEEYNTLRESIQKEGLLHPITVNKDGIILDGHHRHRVCKELGVSPEYKILHIKDKLEEKLFVITYNNARRHSNKFQRVEQALKAKPILQEIAKRNESLGGKGDRNLKTFRVNEEIGKKAGVSRDTIRKVEKILKCIPPDFLDKVRTEEISINQAYNEITFAEQKAEQTKKLQEKFQSDGDKTLAELTKINEERISLRNLVSSEEIANLPEQEQLEIGVNLKKKTREFYQKKREWNMLCNKVWFDNAFLETRDPRTQDLFRKLSYLSQHEPETMERIFNTLNQLPEPSSDTNETEDNPSG